MNKVTTPVSLLVLLSVVLCGCATGDPHFARTRSSEANVYMAPNPPHVEKVAIMPFKAPTELIGSAVSDLFVTEMLRAGRYTIVERSQMAQVLNEAELGLAGLSDRQAIEMGAMMGADAVIVGTVSEYGASAQRGRTWPVVGISTRLVDCDTGRVVWSVDLAQKAKRRDAILSQHARAVVHQMCSALYKEWRRAR